MPTPLEPRLCRDCQRTFTPTRKHQIFCSSRCKNHHHNSARLALFEKLKAKLV